MGSIPFFRQQIEADRAALIPGKRPNSVVSGHFSFLNEFLVLLDSFGSKVITQCEKPSVQAGVLFHARL